MVLSAFVKFLNNCDLTVRIVARNNRYFVQVVVFTYTRVHGEALKTSAKLVKNVLFKNSKHRMFGLVNIV